ncbi:MAG: alpha/beta hydrolase [Gammaproteobacteria bacterium]|jgi:pimeloyl-ACP methyl ester carboxylesterase
MRHRATDGAGRRWYRSAAGALLLLFGLAAGNAAAYTLNHANIDIATPPGKRVDIGGYRLHIYCLGQGSPTVVFDSGMGGFSLEWADVQTALSRYTRVCTYDRAGYGWSDRSPYSRTTRVMARELHRLLRAADVPAPYILAGHSFGGYNIRYFAGEFPREVAGLVLIDASHPRQFSYFPKAPVHKVSVRRPPRSSRIHIVRPAFPLDYPEQIRQLAYMLMVRRHSARIQLQELEHFQESAQQVVAQGARFPRLPVTILTRGERVWPNTFYGDAMERVWSFLQHDLLSLSDRSEQVIALHSGHAIQLDQPQLVITAVLKELRIARWEVARSNLVGGVNAGVLPAGWPPYSEAVTLNAFRYPRFTGPDKGP